MHHNRKPMTLMDMATIAMKEQRKLGSLNDLEVSDEINACSIYIDVDVDGETEPWLLMFKNETHNHPTEIEPFGGASTVSEELFVTHYQDALMFTKRCVLAVEQMF